jgi:hypothetical protein
MVNIPQFCPRGCQSAGVMTPAILVTVSFCTASISYAPFLVLLDMLPLLVEAVLGIFVVVFAVS